MSIFNFESNVALVRKLKSELIISAPVGKIFQWFVNLDSNYVNWHPETHEELKWVTQNPVKKGSMFYFIETVCGQRRKVFLEVTTYKKNMKLSFCSKRIILCSNKKSDIFLSALASLFRIKIRMERTFKKLDTNSTLLYTTHIFGSDLPILKNLVNWIIRKYIFPEEEHRKHMAEENENMKCCIENS